MIAHAVIEGYNRGDGIPDAHGGEDDHLLDFAVKSLDGNSVFSCLRQLPEDEVQSIGHDRKKSLRNDGRESDDIDFPDDRGEALGFKYRTRFSISESSLMWKKNARAAEAICPMAVA